MGELVRANVVLLPLAVDPLGKWGPMMDRFLFGTDARRDFSLPTSHPNGRIMLRRAQSPECPTGVLVTASLNWKRHGTRKFYGHTYTAPTPREYTLQQLGLTVSKALALHLRNATRKFGAHPKPLRGRGRGTALPTSAPPPLRDLARPAHCHSLKVVLI